jgi:hypothetical protein
MARSAAQTSKNQADQIAQSKPTDLTERRLRRVGAWFLLYLALQAELGLAWDRNWHDLIGRDQFWTLPHIMLYAGVGGAGLIALIVITADTLRYNLKKPGVDDTSTIRILGIFHAPMGYILLGFGALTDLVAAPLDNYWHQLYGIDVTLWSPFHVMGTIGGILEGLGIIYIFASEVVIERQAAQSGHPAHRFLGFSALEWGVLTVLAAYMNLTIPALTAFTAIPIGPLQLFTYPFALALAGGFSLVSGIQLTRKPGSATITALLLCIEALYTQAFVPFAIRTSVAWLGFSYRFADRRPTFNLTLALIPLLFLLSAVLIDWLTYRHQQRHKTSYDILPGTWLLAIVIALPAVVIPPLLTIIVQAIPAFSPLPAGMFALQAQWLDMLIALPFTLLIVVAMIGCGKVFGDIWYMNRR